MFSIGGGLIFCLVLSVGAAEKYLNTYPAGYNDIWVDPQYIFITPVIGSVLTVYVQVHNNTGIQFRRGHEVIYAMYLP